MKRACLLRSLCNNPVKKNRSPKTFKRVEKRAFPAWQKKQPPEPNIGSQKTWKTIGKSSKSPQLPRPGNGPAATPPQWGTSESTRIPL